MVSSEIKKSGLLTTLPREVRDHIWDEVALLVKSEFPTSPNPATAILRTCKQIHTEVSSRIYDHEVLTIKVIPYQSFRKFIVASISNGTTWQLKSFQGAVSKGFGALPLEKFEKVQTAIAAPLEEEIQLLYRIVRDLAEFLERNKRGFRHLGNSFEDNDRFQGLLLEDDEKRFPGGEPRNCDSLRRTQKDLRIPHYDNNDDDYEMILNLFSRIRMVKNTTFVVPEPEIMKPNTRLAFLRLKFSLEQNTALGNLEWKSRFKTNIIEKNYDAYLWINDQYKQTELDLTYLKMERILDRDPYRDRARVSRFASWYSDEFHGKSRYEEDLKRILLSRNCFDKNVARDANNRYRVIRLLDPLNYNYIRQLEWDPEEWYGQYPMGIRAFGHSSHSCRANLLRFLQEPGVDKSFAWRGYFTIQVVTSDKDLEIYHKRENRVSDFHRFYPHLSRNNLKARGYEMDKEGNWIF